MERVYRCIFLVRVGASYATPLEAVLMEVGITSRRSAVAMAFRPIRSRTAVVMSIINSRRGRNLDRRMRRHETVMRLRNGCHIAARTLTSSQGTGTAWSNDPTTHGASAAPSHP